LKNKIDYSTINFAEEFKTARIEAGLTQVQMLEHYDIPHRTVQDWERGIRIPPPYVKRLVLEELKRKKKKTCR
jgi:DNA-binding transcriptional regulator YiaG